MYLKNLGAAYGIVSIIKGLGIYTIKDLEICDRLKALLAHKENPVCRKGALICIEVFCMLIGKLFE